MNVCHHWSSSTLCRSINVSTHNAHLLRGPCTVLVQRHAELQLRVRRRQHGRQVTSTPDPSHNTASPGQTSLQGDIPTTPRQRDESTPSSCTNVPGSEPRARQHSPSDGLGWSGAGMQGRGKRESSEKARRQAASSSENPGVNPAGIGPGEPWWEASALATAPPLPLYSGRDGAVVRPLASANRVRFPHVGIALDNAAGVGWPSPGSPASPAVAYRRCSIQISLRTEKNVFAPPSAIKTLILRGAKVSPLCNTLDTPTRRKNLERDVITTSVNTLNKIGVGEYFCYRCASILYKSEHSAMSSLSGYQSHNTDVFSPGGRRSWPVQETGCWRDLGESVCYRVDDKPSQLPLISRCSPLLRMDDAPVPTSLPPPKTAHLVGARRSCSHHLPGVSTRYIFHTTLISVAAFASKDTGKPSSHDQWRFYATTQGTINRLAYRNTPLPLLFCKVVSGRATSPDTHSNTCCVRLPDSLSGELSNVHKHFIVLILLQSATKRPTLADVGVADGCFSASSPERSTVDGERGELLALVRAHPKTMTSDYAVCGNLVKRPECCKDSIILSYLYVYLYKAHVAGPPQCGLLVVAFMRTSFGQIREWLWRRENGLLHDCTQFLLEPSASGETCPQGWTQEMETLGRTEREERSCVGVAPGAR
ncbi:hypothetical protein PR048_025455 [Dryococelus australis]|uniref:Uncharacterized protein n=1 Tax=Dryococelus australis TaxID=614101 RepID=A0ABQ9GRH4_9NEOP|nr:hypothetical protein PR048_025455 [Dryococelus australis]